VFTHGDDIWRVNSSAPDLLVPPVRLGRLLCEAREAQGRTPSDLARGCGLAYDERWFADLEAGRVPLDDPLVKWVSALYGIDAGELAPSRSRLIIDLDEGVMAVGARSIALPGGQQVPTFEQVLTNYLALVYLLRDVDVGTPIPLREVDVDVLAHSLQRNRRDVQSTIGRLITNETAALTNRSTHLRRRVIVPVAGILVSLTAVGGLLLVRSSDSDAMGEETPAGAGSSSTANEIPVDVGDAIVLERGGTVRTR
jgi:transcriptional regulator with XRE-family HTH domain